jgi:hypothetical protein
MGAVIVLLLLAGSLFDPMDAGKVYLGNIQWQTDSVRVCRDLKVFEPMNESLREQGEQSGVFAQFYIDMIVLRQDLSEPGGCLRFLADGFQKNLMGELDRIAWALS